MLLEAYLKPTIMQVLHPLEIIKTNLQLLFNGVRPGSDLIIVKDASQTLAIATLDAF